MMTNMFDGMIEEYGEKLRPHFTSAAQQLDAFRWHVLARLDQIIENTSADKVAHGRMRYSRALTAAAGAVELDTIPMGQEWTLEVAAVSPGATLTLTDGTGFVLGIQSGGATPSIVFPKGGKVVASVSADAQVFLQFKVKAPTGGKDARTGFVNPDATGGSGATDLPVYRHSAPGVGHRPIVPSGDAPHGGTQGV